MAIRPRPCGLSVPPRPSVREELRLDGRRHATREARPPDGSASANSGISLLARDLGAVQSHVLGIVSLQQARGHPPLACSPDPDGAEDALLGDVADLVQVGAGDAASVYCV